MRFLSVRLRLMLTGAVAVLVALALATAGLATLFERHIERVAVRDLEHRLEQLASWVELGDDGAFVVEGAPADPLFDRPYSGRYWQVRAPGALKRSRSLWDYALPFPEDAAFDALWSGALAGPSGENLLAVARRFRLVRGASDVVIDVAVATGRADLDAARRGFLSDLVPYFALLFAALTATLTIAVTIAMRPLSTIGDRLTALGEDRNRRLGANVPAEVAPLAERIDALLDSHEAEAERARRRSADLAHGFKTPLQALLGEAARMRAAGDARAGESIASVVREMRSHVDRELARARLETAADRSICDPLKVAEAVASVLRKTPKGAAIRIAVRGPGDATVAANEADLAEALGAIAENAVSFARASVELAVEPRGPRTAIRARDDGPGVDPAKIAGLKDRGLTLATRGDGAGLGLAIANEVAAACGGELVLRNLDPGFEAELLIPTSA